LPGTAACVAVWLINARRNPGFIMAPEVFDPLQAAAAPGCARWD